MRRALFVGIPVLCVALSGGILWAQAPGALEGAHAARVSDAGQGPVVLEWVPPALQDLSAQASTRTSFTLDRSMLGEVSGLMADQDDELRQTLNKLEGVSVHALRFAGYGIADPAEVDQVREAYHLRGWKHLVTTTRAGGPVHRCVAGAGRRQCAGRGGVGSNSQEPDAGDDRGQSEPAGSAPPARTFWHSAV